MLIDDDSRRNETLWGDKRYHSLDFELKKTYGRKLYKLSINGGMTCPNRDGTLDTRGCIFCSEGGSGDFAASFNPSVKEQLENAKLLVSRKLSGKEEVSYIAYFQAYTNTYAPVAYLEKIFMEAIQYPETAILSIATRPDCLNTEVLDLLGRLNRLKPVWVELGLQTIHADTAEFIRRGFSLTVFETAVSKLREVGITVIVHTILGLPKESKHDMLETMEYIGKLPVQGIKLQLLHVLKETDLGRLWEEGTFSDPLSLPEYTDLIISCLEVLPGDIVIHRITGDGPKKLLLAPLWSSDKKAVLNNIHREMKLRDTWQGKLFHPTSDN
jgi:hypothetical protein